jgi:hypothetical protein
MKGLHRFLGGAIMALAGTLTMLTIASCDGDNKQYIPSVEAAAETHIVEFEMRQIEYKPFYALYARTDTGAEILCIAVENSGNDSKTSALECK